MKIITPKRITLILTEKCNFNCHHCYIRITKSNACKELKELSYSKWAALIKQAYDLGFREIAFTGGEPLIRDDFLQIYKLAFKLGYRVIILTNGSMLNDYIITELIKKPPEFLLISLYGWNKESYASNTGNKISLELFTNGIELLFQSMLPFRFRIPPVKSLIEMRNRVLLFAQELSPFSKIELGWYLSRRIHDDDPLDNILKQRLHPKDAVDIIFESNVMNREQMTRIYAKRKKTPNLLFPCSVGRSPSIDPYGIFQPCIEMHCPATACDLNVYSLSYAINRHIPKIKKMVIEEENQTQECINCRIREFCFQCPACSWLENGSLYTPTKYLCEIARELSNRIMVNTNGEMQLQKK